MPVGMVRAALAAGRSLDARGDRRARLPRGRFDQLDEDTSPFNLSPLARRSSRIDAAGEPAWRGRCRAARALSVDHGRVDWSVSAYRGFELRLTGRTTGAAPTRFPRFTMVGGDFETVRGAVGGPRRGGGVRRSHAAGDRRRRSIARGHAVEGGLGVDRKAGELPGQRQRGAARSARRRRCGDAIGPTSRSSAPPIAASRARRARCACSPCTIRRRTVPSCASIAAVSLRDNVWLEGSGGMFAGDGVDALGRLARRDFLYARLRCFFESVAAARRQPGADDRGGQLDLPSSPGACRADRRRDGRAGASGGPGSRPSPRGPRTCSSRTRTAITRRARRAGGAVAGARSRRCRGPSATGGIRVAGSRSRTATSSPPATPSCRWCTRRAMRPITSCFWHEPTRTVLPRRSRRAQGSTVVIPATSRRPARATTCSLERVLALAPARLLPAHGPPIDDPAGSSATTSSTAASASAGPGGARRRAFAPSDGDRRADLSRASPSRWCRWRARACSRTCQARDEGLAHGESGA